MFSSSKSHSPKTDIPFRLGVVIFILLTFYDMTLAKTYKGGELRTIETFTYGRFEVRMKSARGSGLLSSFFTYHDGGLDWNELDVEILGSKFNEVQFNAISPGRVDHVYTKTTSYSPHSSYHVYAIEWTPAYVAWFIDGEEVHRQSGSHIAQLIHPQKIMMNIWPPDYPSWVGAFDPAILPVFAYYDWVRYYKYDPLNGNYGTNNQFTQMWTDDFPSWDQTRWGKATHTFGGNNSDFVHENIAFYNGNMILCLTEPDDTGFDAAFPPLDQIIHLYNAFEIGDPFSWSLWDGSKIGNITPVPNPIVSSFNPSSMVLEVVPTNEHSYIVAALPEELDLSENHVFSLTALAQIPGTDVIFKLQNNKAASPTASEVTSRRTLRNADEWTRLHFDFSPAVNRNDLNQIAIQFLNGNALSDTSYVDDIYGPPILSTDIDAGHMVPAEYDIYNFPNPFNNSTTFTFKLPESTQVQFDMFDLRGNQVAEITSGYLIKGEHQVNWSGEHLNSGIYLSRLRYRDVLLQKKILLIK